MTNVAFLKKHCYAVIIAFLVGIIYLLPNILFMIEAGEDYHYPMLAMPDERHYATRINEVYDGHYTIANPDLKEYKQSPYFWQPLSELIVGGTGKLLGLKIETLLVISDFLFPFLFFIVLYIFGFYLLGSTALALIGSCAVMMVSIVVFGPPQALLYWLMRLPGFDIHPVFNPKASFLFSRSINPQFNIIFLFLSFIGVYGIIFREAKGYVIFTGVLIGSFFYGCGFYYWSYVIGGCGLFSLYSLAKNDYQTFWKLAFSVLVGALISIPYWFGVFALKAAPFYDEALNRTYMIATHKPYLNKIELLAIIVFLIFYPKKDRPFVFITSFLMAGLVVENSQVITGMEMHPYHWSIYCQGTLMWWAYALMAYKIGQRWADSRIIGFIKGRKTLFTSLLIILIFINALHTQVVYTYATDRESGPRAFYEKSLPVWLDYQKLYPALDWLNTQGEKDSVVLSSVWTSYLITSFTHCNILVGWHTHIYLLSDEELLERWLVKSYFFNVPDDLVFKVLEPNLDGVCELCPWRWHEEERPAFRLRLIETYRKLKQQSIEAVLNKYGVDYILFSPSEKEEYLTHQTGFDISQYSFLESVVKGKNSELFKVRLP